ncbi:hypothetical protein BT96DRAFT_1025555 [Gymnopus androsaceus JB14]|uniref:Uncharacterized protein n=1 Tax=Gymnopus androsaceus JB14 TaxID=1447944 RepID=A0A6A4GRZ9_9AGAR|nr:hypothetical protein BT96DRAFT_1025555 [Gymnopus androsaceus JB14]
MPNNKENPQQCHKEVDHFFDKHFDNIGHPPVSPYTARDQINDDPWYQSSSPANQCYSGSPSFPSTQPGPILPLHTEAFSTLPTPKFLPALSCPITPVTIPGQPLTASPSRHWNFNMKQACRQISNSTATAKASKTSTEVSKLHFNGLDLVEMARQAIEINPFLATHGQKGKVWKELTGHLVVNLAFHLKNIEWSSIWSKVIGLVAYKKNPTSTSREVCAIAKILDKDQSFKITIAALLECLEKQHDDAEHKSEEQKAALKKWTYLLQADEDDEGGAKIWKASMMTFINKKRNMKHPNDLENDTSHGSPKHSSKKMKCLHWEESTGKAIISLIEKGQEEQKVYQEHMKNLMESSEKLGIEMAAIMVGFLDIEKAGFKAEEATKNAIVCSLLNIQ